MYGHPIIVHITAVILSLPSFFKHEALAAKAELKELKEDIAHATMTKKAIIKSYH